MDRLYSFYDYEQAYYKGQIARCKEIGCYLLKQINNKKAKQLYNKLSKVKYTWDVPKVEQKYIAKLLLDVKLWLMVHS